MYHSVMDLVCSNLTMLTTIVGTLLVGAAVILVLMYYKDITKYHGFLMTVAFVLLLVCVACIDFSCIVPTAKAAFKRDYEIEQLNCFLPRHDKIAPLLSYLEANDGPKDKPGYALLEGLHGTGKSTILQQLLPPYSESGIPHIYVSIDANGDVTKKLYKALNLEAYCDSLWASLRSYLHVPSYACPTDPKARLDYILDVLRKAVGEIRHEDGFLPLIVYDHTARILIHPDGEKVLYRLQDEAKDASDQGSMVVLFSASDGSVPDILRSRSASSRMTLFLNVGEIKNDEALSYLTCMCPNAKKEVLEEAVSVFGGRFIYLNKVATALKVDAENGLADVRASTFKDIRMSITNLHAKPQETLMFIVEKIMNSQSKMFPYEEWQKLKNSLPDDELQAIIKTNILYVEAGEEAGVFMASRVVEKYFEKMFPPSDE